MINTYSVYISGSRSLSNIRKNQIRNLFFFLVVLRDLLKKDCSNGISALVLSSFNWLKRRKSCNKGFESCASKFTKKPPFKVAFFVYPFKSKHFSPFPIFLFFQKHKQNQLNSNIISADRLTRLSR